MNQPQIELERRSGLSSVEVRDGFAQVRVARLGEPLGQARVDVLALIQRAEISVDFLKLTPDGLAFVVAEALGDQVAQALSTSSADVSVRGGRSIVLVHGVNMRDEEGLIARILATAIASGATFEHLGDMHDRVLIVTDNHGARAISERIESQLVEAQR